MNKRAEMMTIIRRDVLLAKIKSFLDDVYGDLQARGLAEYDMDCEDGHGIFKALDLLETSLNGCDNLHEKQIKIFVNERLK